MLLKSTWAGEEAIFFSAGLYFCSPSCTEVGLVASSALRAPRLGDAAGSVPAPPERTSHATHVQTQLGAVAADEPRCSAVGADALADGGSAVDAAVAATLCLGVTHPHSSGAGGGAFMIVHSRNGSSEVLEFRERAPAAAGRDMFAASNATSGEGSASESDARPSEFGGAAAAVPTELHGLRLAWERHGVLPWSRLVEPAAALADGFTVGPELARAIEENAEALKRFPATKAVFLRADASPLREGDVCRNAALARTLRRVASEGPSVLRFGALAEALARDVQDAGGIMTAEDLASYAPRVLEPLRADVLGYAVLGVPPPSSGGAAVAQILELVSGYARPLASAPDGSLGTHRLVEAFKHAFAMRMNLGDPEVPPPPGVVSNISGAVRDMLSPAFNAALRAMTKDDATLPLGAYGARWNLVEDHGTTHVSVVDADRNAVAMTSTINTNFGSKVVSRSTGTLLNNEMDDFSVPNETNHYGLAPSAANFIAPRRRPLSSMSPTVVLDANQNPPRVVAVAGASGGRAYRAGADERCAKSSGGRACVPCRTLLGVSRRRGARRSTPAPWLTPWPRSSEPQARPMPHATRALRVERVQLGNSILEPTKKRRSSSGFSEKPTFARAIPRGADVRCGQEPPARDDAPRRRDERRAADERARGAERR